MTRGPPAQHGTRRQHRAIAILIIASILAAPASHAHGAPDPTAAYTRLVHDCNDDHGGESANLNGHDLIALDLREETDATLGHLLVFQLYFNGGFATLDRADHLLDRIKFNTPAGEQEIWLRADVGSGPFEERPYNQQFTAADQGTAPIAAFDGPRQYRKNLDPAEDYDGNRATLDLKIKMADLGVRHGDVLTDVEATSHFVRGTTATAADHMPFGVNRGTCPPRPDATYYRSSGYTVVGPPNQPPAADFTFPSAPRHVGTNIQFTNGATDPDGDPLGFTWDFGDGATSSATNPTHAFGTPGTYTVQLTANDGRGGSHAASKQVAIVAAPNDPPVAAFVAEPDGLAVNLDASQSSDPDGDALSYAWVLGDGSTATSTTVYHEYASAGTYTVKLTVSDGRATDEISKSVTVSPAVHAPTAAFTMEPANPVAGQTVWFNDTSSDDGTIVSRRWEFGDGDTQIGTNVEHAYAAGSFTVVLKVTDNDGLVARRELAIQVAEPEGTTDQPDPDDDPPPADDTDDDPPADSDPDTDEDAADEDASTENEEASSGGTQQTAGQQTQEEEAQSEETSDQTAQTGSDTQPPAATTTPAQNPAPQSVSTPEPTDSAAQPEPEPTEETPGVGIAAIAAVLALAARRRRP